MGGNVYAWVAKEKVMPGPGMMGTEEDRRGRGGVLEPGGLKKLMGFLLQMSRRWLEIQVQMFF